MGSTGLSTARQFDLSLCENGAGSPLAYVHEVAAILTEPEPGPYGDSRTSGHCGRTPGEGIAVGWGMWVLMLVGTAAFWVAVLMGIRALFWTGESTVEHGRRDTLANDATRVPSPAPTASDPPTRTDSPSLSREEPHERHP